MPDTPEDPTLNKIAESAAALHDCAVSIRSRLSTRQDALNRLREEIASLYTIAGMPPPAATTAPVETPTPAPWTPALAPAETPPPPAEPTLSVTAITDSPAPEQPASETSPLGNLSLPPRAEPAAPAEPVAAPPTDSFGAALAQFVSKKFPASDAANPSAPPPLVKPDFPGMPPADAFSLPVATPPLQTPPEPEPVVETVVESAVEPVVEQVAPEPASSEPSAPEPVASEPIASEPVAKAVDPDSTVILPPAETAPATPVEPVAPPPLLIPDPVPVPMPAPKAPSFNKSRWLILTVLPFVVPFSVYLARKQFLAKTRTPVHVAQKAPPPPPPIGDAKAVEAVALVKQWRMAGDDKSLFERLGSVVAHPDGSPAWSAEMTDEDSYLVIFREAGGTAYAFETNLKSKVVQSTPEASERLTLIRVRDQAAAKLKAP